MALPMRDWGTWGPRPRLDPVFPPPLPLGPDEMEPRRGSLGVRAGGVGTIPLPLAMTSMRTPATQGDAAEGGMSKERECLVECCKRDNCEHGASTKAVPALTLGG